MCGIAGILRLSHDRPDRAALEMMLNQLSHRGPDGRGAYVDAHVALGHTRLSIIDLSGGAQPMANADQTLWIVFNGEIFNYVELRADLLRNGHRFATRSDTEVILHLYEDHGADCVRCLNGQWAFAIWDTREQCLFLSRDRLGVRPLFYASTARYFVFGSEAKAMFTVPDLRRTVDPVGLDQIFTFWTTLPPRTVFQDVLELPPGHSLVVRDGELRLSRHWQLAFSRYDIPSQAASQSEMQYAEQLLALLIDATRLRLRSDVPVGAYLSGGLDSSVLAALVRRFTDTPLKTFSVAFEDQAFDESAYQREVSAFLGTEHHELRCSHADISRVFPDIVWRTEKPLFWTSAAPLFLLSQVVRDTGLKVILTGEGADELLAGYDIFKEAKIWRFCASQPGSSFRPLLLRRLQADAQSLLPPLDFYSRILAQLSGDCAARPFLSHLSRWERTAQLKSFFSRSLKAEIGRYDATEELRGLLPSDYREWDWLSQAQYLETTQALSGHLLSSQGDRMAMAHSVEGRFPFLDPRVIEFATSLPPRLRLKALNEKHLLKVAARELVPEAVRRRTKHAYAAPRGRCFFPSGAGTGIPEYVEDLLSYERVAQEGLFEPTLVVALAQKFRSGREVDLLDNMALVAILSTGLLVEQFIGRLGQRLVSV